MPIEQPVEIRSAVVASPGFMASIASVFIQDMARAAGSADFASLPCARSSAFVSAASDSCWRLLLASRRCSGPSGLFFSTSSSERMERTVREIAGDYAVLENESGGTTEVALALLPDGIREGMVLIFENFEYRIKE